MRATFKLEARSARAVKKGRMGLGFDGSAPRGDQDEALIQGPLAPTVSMFN